MKFRVQTSKDERWVWCSNTRRARRFLEELEVEDFLILEFEDDCFFQALRESDDLYRCEYKLGTSLYRSEPELVAQRTAAEALTNYLSFEGKRFDGLCGLTWLVELELPQPSRSRTLTEKARTARNNAAQKRYRDIEDAATILDSMNDVGETTGFRRRTLKVCLDYVAAVAKTGLRSHQLAKRLGKTVAEGNVLFSQGLRILKHYDRRLLADSPFQGNWAHVQENAEQILELIDVISRGVDASDRWRDSADEVKFGLQIGQDLPVPSYLSEKLQRNGFTRVGLLSLLPLDCLKECGLSEMEVELLAKYLSEYGITALQIKPHLLSGTVRYADHITSLPLTNP